MKTKVITFIASSFFAMEARAELTKDQAKQGQSLITFYKAVTGYEDAFPLLAEQSECARGVCAFNFETDRENFGILANSVPFSDDLWSGFTADPNGVSLGEEEEYLDLSIEAYEDGEVLAAENVKAIGEKIEKAFTAIGWDVGTIAVDVSICRSSAVYVSCFLNFDTGREHFGVSFRGLLGADKNSIDYIETLDTHSNGVSW